MAVEEEQHPGVVCEHAAHMRSPATCNVSPVTRKVLCGGGAGARCFAEKITLMQRAVRNCDCGGLAGRHRKYCGVTGRTPEVSRKATDAQLLRSCSGSDVVIGRREN